jgi:hypothetical protein
MKKTPWQGVANEIAFVSVALSHRPRAFATGLYYSSVALILHIGPCLANNVALFAQKCYMLLRNNVYSVAFQRRVVNIIC